jgi:hypothetical protein
LPAFQLTHATKDTAVVHKVWPIHDVKQEDVDTKDENHDEKIFYESLYTKHWWASRVVRIQWNKTTKNRNIITFHR